MISADTSRSLRLIATLAAVLVALGLYGIAVGPADISVIQVVKSLVSRIAPVTFDDLSGIAGWRDTIIWQVRIPRVLVAGFVGAALAASGAVLQGLFRNPLASPDILGVTSGASLGAAIAIFFGLATAHVLAVPLFAIVFASVTMAAVYAISMRGGRAAIATLILAGVAISALNGAMRSFILSLALRSYEVGSAIVYWSLGSLEGRTWEHVFLIAPVFILIYLFLRRYTRELDIMLLGEVHAVSVGVDVARVRLRLLLATAVVGGVAVAASGGIGFVGLVAPHMVRLMIGPHHRLLLPMSALAGAVMLVGSDLLLRSVFAEFNIPVGALTALLGAPFFAVLLMRQRKGALI